MILSIAIFLLSATFFLLAHKVLCKTAKGSGQRQRQLILLIISFSLFFLPLAVCVGGMIHPFIAENWPVVTAYEFITFNAFAYTYFHLFNMSETSRRGRMLREIGSGHFSSLSEVQNTYSPEVMLTNRLTRLQALGEITLGNDGRFRYIGRGLIFFARFFQITRSLVLGKLLREPTQESSSPFRRSND